MGNRGVGRRRESLAGAEVAAATWLVNSRLFNCVTLHALSKKVQETLSDKVTLHFFHLFLLEVGEYFPCSPIFGMV